MRPVFFYISFFLCVTICRSQPALIVGQTQDMMFTDIVPDINYSCTWPLGQRTCTINFDFDVNHDGAIDFYLGHHYAECWPTTVRRWSLHPVSNVEFVVDSLGITPLTTGDTVGRNSNQIVDFKYTEIGLDTNFNPIYDTTSFVRNSWWIDTAQNVWGDRLITYTGVGTGCDSGPANWDHEIPDTNYFAFRLIGSTDTVYGWMKIYFSSPQELRGASFAVTGDTGTYIYSGTEDIEKEQKINLYPNPTSDKLFIEAPFEEYAMEIFSVVGVKQTSINNLYRNQGIDVAKLSKGFYIINLSSNGRKIAKSFIKK